MRLIVLSMFFSLIYIVSCKNNVKTLTESMGQEVIEIGTPIKELPIGLEEEPAAENDEVDDKHKSASNTIQPITKKEVKRTTTVADIKKQGKDIEKIDGMSQEDEEARIEKELAEIYKDTADYKADSGEEKEIKTEVPASDLPNEDETSSEEPDKPIGRQKTKYFKFQPDTTDKADIERFRTSVDVINCYGRQKLKATAAPGVGSNAINTINNGLGLVTAVLCCIFICT